MTPEALDLLSKQELIALVLAQMEQIRLLTARRGTGGAAQHPAQDARQFISAAVEGSEGKPPVEMLSVFTEMRGKRAPTQANRDFSLQYPVIHAVFGLGFRSFEKNRHQTPS
jgi:hypothetical protein